MELSPRHLRLLVALADLGSETGAAAELGMTQPAISIQLRRLESALGLTLFTRLPSGLEPTADGADIVDSARRVLQDIDAMNDRITQLSSEAALTFRVVSVAYGAGSPTGRILRNFIAAWPGATITVDQVGMADRLFGLLDGRSDAIMTLGPIDHPDIEARLLFEDDVVAACAADSALAQRPCVGVDDILDEPIIAGSLNEEAHDREWHDFWVAKDHRAGRPAPIAGRYATPEMHFDAVAMGQGISLMTASTGHMYHRTDVVFVPVLGMATVPHWVAWNRWTRKQDLVDSFVSIAEHTLQQWRLASTA